MQEQTFIGLDDEALVGRLFELAGGVDDHELRDELHAGLSEAFERWAPEALKRETWQALKEDEVEHAARELDDWLAGVESRRAFRPLAQQLSA